MEYLTFQTFTRMIQKNQMDLYNNGYIFYYIEDPNIYNESFIIYKILDNKTYNFYCNMREWDRYKKFIIYINPDILYHYCIDINNQWVYKLNNIHPSEDLMMFFNNIIKIICDFSIRIKNDKITIDFKELGLIKN